MIAKTIGYFIPPEYFKNEETLRKAKLTVSVYAFVAVAAFWYSYISWDINFWGGMLSQVPNFCIALICLFFYHKKVKPSLVNFIFLSEISLSIVIAIYYSGGFSSFILPWLVLPPLVALLISGKKFGGIILFSQLLLLTLFYFFEIYKITLLPVYRLDFPIFFIYSCYLGLIILLFVIAAAFETSRLNSMKTIVKKNDELQYLLDELKNTQQQLVQQEKLASLGQLTAGIAHEIKNPLNFVNNFSELSTELVQEVRNEIDSLGVNHDLSLRDVYGVLNDIETNLKIIHKHGSRADGIVKSMLEHSRGGTGKMEPTDLNVLVKEFANLSFHGMRAGKNPINVDMEFDLDEDIGKVPLTAEDFSRVIVNLCNNAFDAMRDMVVKTQNIASPESTDTNTHYQPKLTIRTKVENGKVVVEIEDNGPGIPEEMKDKIMQPFFTTKKGTEGTGLGLSITNDIIKAHGGNLEIKSKPDNHTIFIVSLTKTGAST